jgi:hypothetical protein
VAEHNREGQQAQREIDKQEPQPGADEEGLLVRRKPEQLRQLFSR